MSTTTFTQTPRKFSQGGNIFNLMMTCNSSLPVVGEGMTEIMYSDRRVWEVMAVSKDGKRVEIRQYRATAAKENSPMGHQDWKLELTDCKAVLVWRRGGWYYEDITVVFTKEMAAKLEDSGKRGYVRLLTEEQRVQVYGGEAFPQNVVEGITRATKKYSPVKVLFGAKDYYYDWSF